MALSSANKNITCPYFHFRNMYFTDVNGSAGTHKLYRAQLDGGYPVVLLSDLNQPKSKKIQQQANYFTGFSL